MSIFLTACSSFSCFSTIGLHDVQYIPTTLNNAFSVFSIWIKTVKYILTTMLTSIFIYIAALLLIYVEAAPSFASSEYYLGDHNHASKMLVENKGLMVNVTSTDLAMMKDMIERGNMAMGFNQSKIMHHFIATPTGGEIMIVALNSTDNNTI